MFYIYILISKNRKRTYTGCTINLENRLKKHNSGNVKSSQPYLPYEILHSERFLTLQETRRKEKFFKSTSGRRKIKEFIEKYRYRYINAGESASPPSAEGETSPEKLLCNFSGEVAERPIANAC